MYKHCFWYL